MIDKTVNVCLVGANLNTGNLGVSALAVSTIKLVVAKWPGAMIYLLGTGYTPETKLIDINKTAISINNIPIRYSKHILSKYHIFNLFLATVKKVLSKMSDGDFKENIDSLYSIIHRADVILDITGGDSFSDIYGLQRFFKSFLLKWLISINKKKVVLMPQTYGPFKHQLTTFLAKVIIKRANLVYSRDYDGIKYLKEMLNEQIFNEKVSFSPDVAFILDAKKPGLDLSGLTKAGKNGCVVGLNISGLLFNGGYTQDNMFGLSIDYRQMIFGVIDFIMSLKNTKIVFIPHVISESEDNVENDFTACKIVYTDAYGKYKDRLIPPPFIRCQSEIKYIIGMTDFFLGSRMHSCIAAMSQQIPTIGLAYSKKFKGVFETVGMGSYVADLRNTTVEDIVSLISTVTKEKKGIKDKLKITIPEAQNKIKSILDNI